MGLYTPFPNLPLFHKINWFQATNLTDLKKKKKPTKNKKQQQQQQKQKQKQHHAGSGC